MNEDEKEEKQKLEQAGTNTAHTAGKAAATYFGGTLGNIAYDKISQTKIGQKIEQGVGEAISKVPIANKLNKKLNDSGAVDVASNVIDKSSGSGTLNNRNLNLPRRSQPLNSNLSNQTSDVPEALKNRHQNQSLRNRFLNESNLASTTNDSNNNTTDSETTDSVTEENDTEANDIVKNIGKVSRIVKIISLISPIIIPIIGAILVIILVVNFFSPFIAIYQFFVDLVYNNTENSSYIFSESDPERQKLEKEFYDKIEETINDYKEKYGVTIDKYLLQSILVYRYMNKPIDDLFSTDSGITDADLENALDSLNKEPTAGSENNSTETETSEGTTIDYTSATKKIGVVASLMIKKDENNTYKTDIEIDGVTYNNLLESDFLTSYYSEFLVNNDENSKRNLLNNIYNFADIARNMFEDKAVSSNFVSDSGAVYLQTCFTPYTIKILNGLTVYNNPLTNEGTEYPTFLNLTDYIKGTIMGEVQSYMKDEYREGIKALSIVALSFMLNDSKSGFDLKTGEFYFPTGNCRQVTCDPHYGCQYFYGNHKYGTAYTGTNRFSGVTPHRPLTEEQNAFLDEIIGEIFGDVIVKKGVTPETFTGSKDVQSLHHYNNTSNDNYVPGYALPQVEAMNDAKNGMTYIEILNKYFSAIDFDIINIKEGLYFETEEDYEGSIKLNEDFHFYQSDYKGSNSFCEGGTISARGCSVSSTAIAVSLLTNQRHDPLEISQKLKSAGRCNGDRSSYAVSAASLYNLSSYTVLKNDKNGLNKLLSDLATGNSVVVARIAPNAKRYKTSSGHYIALVGVKTEDERNKVLVWDPGSKSSSRDNYWADFESDIVSVANASQSFVVLSRR